MPGKKTKTKLKKRKRFKEQDKSTKILIVSIIVLLIVIITLCTLIIIKRNRKVLSENVITIPIISTNSTATVELDISNIEYPEIAQYIIKIKKEEDNIIENKNISYEISISKENSDYALALYKNNNDKNLMTNTLENNYVLKNNKLKEDKYDTYYLIIKSTEMQNANANIKIKIDKVLET